LSIIQRVNGDFTGCIFDKDSSIVKREEGTGLRLALTDEGASVAQSTEHRAQSTGEEKVIGEEGAGHSAQSTELRQRKYFCLFCFRYNMKDSPGISLIVLYEINRIFVCDICRNEINRNENES
jgi:hypothetical protein